MEAVRSRTLVTQKEAMFYTPLEGSRVRCHLCARLCNIPEGKVGFCGVRKNVGGKLYSLNYGRLVAMAVDPIEKKPLSHFHPGSYVFSIATVGCNFACMYCQNYDISQRRKVEEPYTPPEEVVRLAKVYHSQGITGTYNEPIIEAEYLIDVMKLAKKEGLFTTWVSNGYFTLEAVDAVAPYLDAITVDFKGSGNQEFYKKYIMTPSAQPIFDALEALKEQGVHIEITNLIVPVPTGSSLDDIKKLAGWVRDHLGDETPFHLLRFHPDYKMMNVPGTPIELLKGGWRLAKQEGLKYVYIGNVYDPKYENTYCPSCGELCIERHVMSYVRNYLKEGARCPSCGYHINVVM